MSVQWVRLQLDLELFEYERFEPYLQGCRQSGIGFTTTADIGDTPGCRRALYELNKTCSADIPERGEFYTFDEYIDDRIEIPTYHPRGVILAISNGVWIGMAATSLRPSEGYAFSEMTCVLPGHRGQGISVAMKLKAIGFARSSHMRWIRTFHHPDNAVAIAINRRLVFVDAEPRAWPPDPAIRPAQMGIGLRSRAETAQTGHKHGLHRSVADTACGDGRVDP